MKEFRPTYRSEIDGLRAFAVVSVILYHANISALGTDLFRGGYIGVDVFFVISGYLIFRIILSELSDQKRFDLFRFYDRRARRILPALYVVIAGSTLVAWRILLPSDAKDYAYSSISTLGFISNFYFLISDSQYGAGPSQLKPLLHTWSLGVEEQFYIVAPVALLIVWRYARRWLVWFLLVPITISVLLADQQAQTNVNAAFFLPQFRMWELLAGGMIAILEKKRRQTPLEFHNNFMSMLGLALLGYSLATFNDKTLHPSVTTMIPVTGTALLIYFCNGHDLVSKCFSFRPFVYVGLLSYSLYLWHFPIFAYARYINTTPSNSDKGLWMVLTLGFSIATFYAVEKPSRQVSRVSGAAFYSAIVLCSLFLGFSNYVLVKTDGLPGRLPSSIRPYLDLKPEVWRHYEDNEACYDRTENFCGERVDIATNIPVYLFGDSHFGYLANQLKNNLPEGYTLIDANAGACPFSINTFSEEHKRCSLDLQKNRLKSLSSGKNGVVILGGRLQQYVEETPFDNLEGGLEDSGFTGKQTSVTGVDFMRDFPATVDAVRKLGHQVILVYPIPEIGFHVPRTIWVNFKENSYNFDYKPPILSIPFQAYTKRTSNTFYLLDSVSGEKIRRVYPHQLFCDRAVHNRCVVNDNVGPYYYDTNHLSQYGAKLVADQIIRVLVRTSNGS